CESPLAVSTTSSAPTEAVPLDVRLPPAGLIDVAQPLPLVPLFEHGHQSPKQNGTPGSGRAVIATSSMNHPRVLLPRPSTASKSKRTSTLWPANSVRSYTCRYHGEFQIIRSVVQFDPPFVEMRTMRESHSPTGQSSVSEFVANDRSIEPALA